MSDSNPADVAAHRARARGTVPTHPTASRDRAAIAASDAPLPRPFVKWVGGKRQLLRALLPFVPSAFVRRPARGRVPKGATYHEPFVGGGALFFELQPERACLSDVNERLVRAYNGVRDDVERVIALLRSYQHDRDFYLAFRAIDIDRSSDAEVAAWLIYLNRTGYNGLYRVNQRNQYNVPFGDYKNPTICDADNLRACSRALRRAKVRHETFEAVLDRAKPGDFVYFDPPYVPLSVTSSFTSYTSDGFDMEQQRRLRDVARELKRRGVHVLLSNSSAPAVYELYRPSFELTEALAKRMVNCKANGRGKIHELIIR